MDRRMAANLDFRKKKVPSLAMLALLDVASSSDNRGQLSNHEYFVPCSGMKLFKNEEGFDMSCSNTSFIWLSYNHTLVADRKLERKLSGTGSHQLQPNLVRSLDCPFTSCSMELMTKPERLFPSQQEQCAVGL
jgi:hypothetical protein